MEIIERADPAPASRRRHSLHFWQAGGGYDRNVRHEDDLNEKLNYMHENPKKRGLVAEAIDWRWSSAQAYAGQTTDGLQPDSWT